MPAAVLWFRRDLRLGDHPALTAALEGGQRVLPLFVLDPRLVDPAGAPRLAFLYRCLRDLDKSLDGRLVVRTGDPATVVPRVAAEVGATTAFTTADFGPYGRERDERVEAALAGEGRRLERVGSPYAVEPGVLATGTGGRSRSSLPTTGPGRTTVAPLPFGCRVGRT